MNDTALDVQSIRKKVAERVSEGGRLIVLPCVVVEDLLRFERELTEARGENERLNDALGRLLRDLEAAKEETADLNQTFELRHAADMRAIKKWREATGRDLVQPDHADLIVWLLEQLEQARGGLDKIVARECSNLTDAGYACACCQHHWYALGLIHTQPTPKAGEE